MTALLEFFQLHYFRCYKFPSSEGAEEQLPVPLLPEISISHRSLLDHIFGRLIQDPLHGQRYLASRKLTNHSVGHLSVCLLSRHYRVLENSCSLLVTGRGHGWSWMTKQNNWMAVPEIYYALLSSVKYIGILNMLNHYVNLCAPMTYNISHHNSRSGGGGRK